MLFANGLSYQCLKSWSVLSARVKFLSTIPINQQSDLYENLIAQLTAYGFSPDSLRLVHDYLLHVKLKSKISFSYIHWLEIRNFFRVNNECEELLGIKYDCKLTFDEHVSDVSKKPGLQLNDLTRISPLM